MMVQKKTSWNSDKSLSLLAIFLSLGTLLVFLYQTNLIKKQQYASVLPYLEIGSENVGTPRFIYAVENKGVGPALIENVEITYKGKPFDGSHVAYIREFFPNLNDSIRTKYFYSAFTTGMFIPSGGRVELIQVKDNQYASDELTQVFGTSNFGLKVTYKSIYEETWTISSGHVSPIKLD